MTLAQQLQAFAQLDPWHQEQIVRAIVATPALAARVRVEIHRERQPSQRPRPAVSVTAPRRYWRDTK